MSDEIAQARRLLQEAQSVLFVTGAGVSADSGLPTYRGIGGLYSSGRTEEGIAIEDAVSGWMLEHRPEICWKYVHQIEAACRGARPNRAHEAIARFEREKARVWVLTQNVDGLHRLAGTRNLVEIHGNFDRLRCTACRWRETVRDYGGLDCPPLCPECGEVVRPEVVLFGEMLPMAAVTRLYAELERGFDLVVSVGTTSVFPYIAEPVLRARALGRPTVEINPGESEVSHLVDLRIRLGAQAAFDAIGAPG